MASMSEIEWESCLLTQRPAPDLERRFERETGRSGRLMRYFEASPWMGDTMLRVSVQITTVVHVDPDLADQVGLVVSQDNSCRFCFGVQRAFMRVIGISEQRIARLEHDMLTGDFSPRERAALDFARRVSQSKPLAAQSDLVPLREAGFGNEEIVELAGLIGLHLFLNRMSTFVALPPQQMEELPDRWWARLLRPLMAIKFRRMRHRGKPVALLDVERTGPMAPIVNALDGLPVARDLRIVIDRLWGSSSLSPRTVSLLYAVVARAFGSSRCEQEATNLLIDQDLAADDIDQVLTHLSSPALSEVEQLLVRLARETVWYQPAQIQRRCAEVQSQLSAEQFLDFLGAVSLLNSLCRLGVITDATA
jgi:AhpD family alkylhydroperoxidase